MGTGLVERIGALAGTPYAAVGVAEAMASDTTSAPIKETFHGCAHGGRNLLNRGVIYVDRLGLGLRSTKKEKGRK